MYMVRTTDDTIFHSNEDTHKSCCGWDCCSSSSKKGEKKEEKKHKYSVQNDLIPTKPTTTKLSLKEEFLKQYKLKRNEDKIVENESLKIEKANAKKKEDGKANAKKKKDEKTNAKNKKDEKANAMNKKDDKKSSK
jgi:hypothetical protein